MRPIHMLRDIVSASFVGLILSVPFLVEIAKGIHHG